MNNKGLSNQSNIAIKKAGPYNKAQKPMLTEYQKAILDLSDMNKAGGILARFMVPGRVICLNGPLGAGKSTLARSMIGTCCAGLDDIPSPTFTLVQPYQADAGFEIWHMDLYRLNRPDEALALGIEEAFFEASCLIEWPDKIAEFLPQNTLHIHIDFADGNQSRHLRLAGQQQLISDIAGLVG